MRRFVLLCMMMLLPLQWSWAAAAAYCAHETGGAAQHMGHHEHQHQAGAEEQSKVPAKTAVDNDCGVCHLSGLHWLDAASHAVLALTAPLPLHEPGVFFRSFVPSGPERPDRPRAA